MVSHRRFRVGNVMLFVLATLALAHSAHGGPFIVRDAQPRAEIVVSEAAVPVVKLAATELRTYVEKITGARLPIAAAPVRFPV